MASGLVSRFCNSVDSYIGIHANFRIEGTLATIDSWCRFGFEIRQGRYIANHANFETTTLAMHHIKRLVVASSMFATLTGSAHSAAQNMPDFSGVWGRNVFNFEPAESGPQPLRNLRRVGADAGRPVVVGDPVPLVGDYRNPILRPEAAAVVKTRGEMSASGHDFPDPSNQCATLSPPYLFSIQLGMQLLQRKDDVVILYNQNEQVRHVRLNSAHPRNLKPTTTGDSIGHYEGDTLVVDTVGVKVLPWTTADRFGTPQSEMMHVIERYRLIDARDATDALKRQEKSDGCVCGGAGTSAFE